MTDPYIGEVRIFGFEFAPMGWAQCNGQSMSAAQNRALYAILGNMYGGDQVNFKLPNLTSGRVPIGSGQVAGLTPRNNGDSGGAAGVKLDKQTVPTHSHTLNGTNSTADVSSPTAQTALARSTGKQAYGGPTNLTYFNVDTLSKFETAGAPHNNMMPFLCLNYCIALQGIFPPRA